MIKMLTAHTREIDFVDEALADILDQLRLDENLLEHSVGLLNFVPDFSESDLIRALCERLPFDVVGCSVLSDATGSEYGNDLLILSVLTSDDVFFSTAPTASLTPGDFRLSFDDAYRRAAAALPEAPVMTLVYMPHLTTISASAMLAEIGSVSDGIPAFGMISCDNSPSYHANACIVHNGEFSGTAAAFVLMSGNVRPQFFVGSFEDFEEVRQQHGIITESDGAILKSVNDMPFPDYLESIGLPLSTFGTMTTPPVPFMVNFNDGTVGAARTLFGLTPEGYALFAGTMPQGGTISVRRLRYESIIRTASDVADALVETGGSCALICSCALRNVLLALRADDEMQAVSNILSDRMPYHMAYVGGEICPLVSDTGALINRSHSFSVVACMLTTPPHP